MHERDLKMLKKAIEAAENSCVKSRLRKRDILAQAKELKELLTRLQVKIISQSNDIIQDMKSLCYET